MNIEIWKPIDGFTPRKISSHGRVSGIRTNLLAPQRGTDGYRHVSIYKNGKMVTLKISRLVAIAFIPNPDGLPFVNHIDCDITNNRVENLEWCTPKQNSQHSMRLGRMRGGHPGKRAANAKVPDALVPIIRKRHEEIERVRGPFAQLGREFGFPSQIMRRVVVQADRFYQVARVGEA